LEERPHTIWESVKQAINHLKAREASALFAPYSDYTNDNVVVVVVVVGFANLEHFVLYA